MRNNKETLNEILSLMIGKRNSDRLIKNTSSINVRKTIDYSEEELYQSVIDEETVNALKLIKKLIVEYFEPEIGDEFILSSPESVAIYLAPYLKSLLGNQSREHFMVLFLNSANKLIDKQVMFIGTLDQAQVYPREIIKKALIKNAASIILVHNHPSGRVTPSSDDEILTRKLEDISSSFGLRVHDHLIATSDSIYSIRAERLIN